MLTSGWIRIVVFLSGGIWFLLLILQGANAQASWLQALGGAAGIVVLLMLGFDRYAWKWRGVHRLTQRRILHGTWKGELQSEWVDPDTKQRIAPIECYLVVHQTYSDIWTALFTADSTSRSATAGLSDPTRGQCLLSSIYQNSPKLLFQVGSRVHRGALVLEIAGSPPTDLEGSYWTDRKTNGQLVFDRHACKTAPRFADAQKLFPSDGVV